MTISELDYQRMLARTELERDKICGRDKIAQATPCELEGPLHDDILAECRRRGWIAIHSRMDVPATVKFGTLDFIIFAGYPRLYIVEAKRGNEKPSAKQRAMIAWFRKLGWDVDVVRSFKHFLTRIAAEAPAIATAP